MTSTAPHHHSPGRAPLRPVKLGPADVAVEHGRRDAARAETADADLTADLTVGLVEAGLQLIERHLDAEPDTGRAQLFDVSLHVRVTPGLWMVTQRWTAWIAWIAEKSKPPV